MLLLLKLERITLIQALDKAAGAWKIKDHPEFKTQEQVYKWVRKSRAEDEKHYRKKGITLAITDTLVVAVAKNYNLILVTANKKDYPMPDLQIREVPTRKET